MRHLPAALGAAVLLLGGATACTSHAERSATPNITRTAGATAGSAATATSGAAESSSAPRATALLRWRPLPGSAQATVISNGSHLLSVAGSHTSYRLDGRRLTPPAGTRVSDALLDDRWALVVAQDPQMQHPEQARVSDLRSGATWTLDRNSDLPTTTGGSWALDGDTAVHATVHDGHFCVATVDLATHASSLGWCAPARHGWNAPILVGGNLTILTFDDHHPSCRTLATTLGGTPFARAGRCDATSGATLPSGAIWLEAPDEHRFELSQVHAATPTGVRALGPADTGTLVVCGHDAYWAVDAQSRGGRAELRRWDGTTMTTVYRSKPGQAFMGEPVCAGSVLTVSSFSTSGDELVAAHVD